MLPIPVELAELQGHYEWKALAILRMAGSRFSAVRAPTTHDFAVQLPGSTFGVR